ncbi:MAG: magnesium chelatase subunit H [Methanotrichaceae archaeon]|nr:magnesium chelatase subunit H [Methanotrichaceae archaeon]
MKITFISTVPASSLAQAAQDLQAEFDLDLHLKICFPRQIDEEEVDDRLLEEELKKSDAVFVDIRGEGRASEVVYKALKEEKNIVVNLTSPFSRMMRITRLGCFSGREMADRIKPGAVRDPEEVWKKMQMMPAAKSVPAGPMKDLQSYIKIARYWRYGGQKNYRNLLLYFMKEYLGCDLPQAEDPQEFPEYGIYHPVYGSFDDLEAFLKCSGFSDSRPTIGALFYGNMHFDQCQSTLEALSEKLGDVNLIPVFSDGIHNLRAMRKFFFQDGRPILDALINLTWFRLNGGPLGGNHALTRDLLKDLNVPVFTPASMYSREVEKWLESPTGLSAPEVIMAVIWPELDGCIESIPCCGVQSIKVGDLDAQDVIPIDDRISRIASRIRNWTRLQKMPNDQKKVAFIIYNYPPGEANLGRASYLDVFKSVRGLLEKMSGGGYRVDLPEKDLHLLFQDYSIVNSGTWFQKGDTLKSCHSLKAEDYQRFFSTLPETMRSDMINSWGKPPGDVMTLGEDILIPGIEFGNVFVGIQPARPPLKDQDLASATHDKTKPPHHQYVAFYRWLQEVWKADLVVHVGTHGLAEFMKGKEVGMSAYCFPDLLIGDMPHLYFYHIVNTSEVVIAKRRLYGTIIGYNSPPYTASDLYEEYAVLQDLIDEYSEAQVQDPVRCERVKEMILDKAHELSFESEDVEVLHDQLYEMKRRIIPDGLHVLGEEYDLSVMKQFVVFLLRYDREGIKSLNRILAESEGIDYDFALRNRARFAGKLARIDEECIRIVEICIQKSPDSAVGESELPEWGKQELLKTLGYGLSLMKNYSQNQGELINYCRGLESEFIEQGDGGDVIRSPEVLPTGRNLTQFDPTKIPTPAAFERGAEIASNTISKYLEKNGSYPENTGVILWGFETTKTGGESVGQILSYLGVKIERSPGALAPRLAVVPLEEMGRPRIDCLVNICGFFRDMFPNVVELLDQAFNLVAGLDEPLEMNCVRKHSLENLEKLQSEKKNGTGPDLDLKTLTKIANGRIFGPRAGEYGTRMLPLVEDSIWKTEDELAEVYIQSMSHLYAKNLHAVKSDAIYRSNLARVDLVSQVRDTHDREIVDLDHYFEYFGGLSNAVRTARGQRPEMLITDTTGEVIQTEDVKDAVTRGVRTRLLNPKWIEGMLKHDYHGAQQVAERLENVLGLAATTHCVENWIWSSIAQRYIFDREIRDKLASNNKFAAVEVAERLLEAEKRGYWKATEEEMEKLRDAYIEMEGDIEEGIGEI